MLPDDHLTLHKIPDKEESNLLWGRAGRLLLFHPPLLQSSFNKENHFSLSPF